MQENNIIGKSTVRKVHLYVQHILKGPLKKI